MEKPPKMTSESSKQHLTAIKTKEKLMEKDIPQLRNWWFQEYKHQLGGMVNRLPPLQEVNHKIPLIEESKHYAYHLPCCTNALKQQLSDKIWLYMDANWWVMKSVPQAALMLCIPKKSGKLWTIIDCCKRNDNMVNVTIDYLSGTSCLLVCTAQHMFPLGLCQYIEDQYVFSLGPWCFSFVPFAQDAPTPVPVLLFASWVG